MRWRKYRTCLAAAIALQNGTQWEEFCRIKVILHVHYRDLLRLTENHTISWIDLYNKHLTEIDEDPKDLIGTAVDNIQGVDDDKSDNEDDDIT